MELSARRRRTLEAICDTFLPALDGLPSATELGVPNELLASVHTRDEKRNLGFILDGFASFRFASKPFETRERELLHWCDSRIWPRRAAFQALRKGTLLHAVMTPSPLWERLGYPGPLGRQSSAPKPLTTLTPPPGTLDCDVVVVGSGAGGGVAAGVLAGAGLDVVVVEAGGYYDDADFDGAEAAGYRRLYLNGGNVATYNRSVELLAGSCLGGGTVVNYTTSFRTPGDVRDEWGAPFTSDEFTRSLDAVCERSGVNTDHNRPSTRDEAMARGLRVCGWHVDAMPRNVVGCDQNGVCGYCGLGCAIGAKQSTVKTWLADAHAAGARIVVERKANRVLVEKGRAVGVECGGGLIVRARAVVVAAGALHTPALLKRSGLANKSIGRHLRLHPTTVLVGLFDEETRPWEGTVQALYSEEHARLTDGYGTRYETGPAHPSLAAAFSPWRGAQCWLELTQRLPHLVGVGILLRDRGSGVVHVDKDGEPAPRYKLSDFDLRHVRFGFDAVARILEEAGAREIRSAHARDLSYTPGPGARERFTREADAAGWGPGRCIFYSFHIMGSARMGSSPKTSACNEDGETWETRNLVVADGSTFPTASGVNPMISIEAVAHLVASRLAARLS